MFKNAAEWLGNATGLWMKREQHRTTHLIGGAWGDRIQWSNTKEFSILGKEFDEEKERFTVHGWKTPLPKKGDKLNAEFERSWIVFEFTKIRPCVDPKDMFFGEVKAVKQVMK